MSSISTNEDIKAYWNQRAQEGGISCTATTEDTYLRELEISTFVSVLQSLSVSGDSAAKTSVVDVGCGDGYSTLQIARSFPQWEFTGLDFSKNMIELARKNMQSPGIQAGQFTFLEGDVLALDKVFGEKRFDFALSDRCLINLDSHKNQAYAIGQIVACLKPGGHYIAIENFMEGQTNLAAARRQMGLSEIPVRWHNRFFTEAEFSQVASQHFEKVTFKDFSSTYYFATRVLYSAMCQKQGVQPDYKHDIHQLATQLPWTGQFSPIRMVVMEGKK